LELIIAGSKDNSSRECCGKDLECDRQIFVISDLYPKSCFSSSERRPNFASSIFIDLLQKLLNVSPLALHALQISLRSEFPILKFILFVIGSLIGTLLRQLYILNCTTLFVAKIGTSTTKLYYPYKDYIHVMAILKYLTEIRYLSTNAIAEKLGKGWTYPQKRVKQITFRLEELGYCTDYRLVSNTSHICDQCKNSTSYLVQTKSLEGALETLENNKRNREEAKKKDTYNSKDWFRCKEGHVLGRHISLECFYCNKHIESHRDEQYKIQQDRYWTLSYNGELVILGILKAKKQYDFIKSHTHNKIIKLVDILLVSVKKDYVERLVNSIKYTIGMKPNLERTADEWYRDINKIILEMKVDEEHQPQLTKYKSELYFKSQTEAIYKTHKAFRS